MTNSTKGELTFLSTGLYLTSSQVEVGPMPSSFIPIDGGVATRGADQITVELGGFRLFTTAVQTRTRDGVSARR